MNFVLSSKSNRKWPKKLKYSRKMHICGIGGLRVKRQIKTMWAFQKDQKRILASFFYSFSHPNAKGLTVKAFLEVSLVSLTLRVHTVF